MGASLKARYLLKYITYLPHSLHTYLNMNQGCHVRISIHLKLSFSFSTYRKTYKQRKLVLMWLFTFPQNKNKNHKKYTIKMKTTYSSLYSLCMHRFALQNRIEKSGFSARAMLGRRRRIAFSGARAFLGADLTFNLTRYRTLSDHTFNWTRYRTLSDHTFNSTRYRTRSATFESLSAQVLVGFVFGAQ